MLKVTLLKRTPVMRVKGQARPSQPRKACRPWVSSCPYCVKVWPLSGCVVTLREKGAVDVETGSYTVAQDGLKFTAIPLPQPPECWGPRCEPPLWI